MKKRKESQDALEARETELEELTDPKLNDSVNQNGGESYETTPSDDIIKKLLPLAGSMGASLAGALLPGSLLGLSGSLLGASRFAPVVMNSLVSMLVGTGAYHSLANIVKDFPDLGAPRFEDAIFQILQSDHSPVGFFVKDLSNKYVYLNKSMLGFIGKPLAEVIGKTDAELFPEEEQTISARNFEMVIKGQMVHSHRERIVEGVPTTLQEIMVAKRGSRYEPVGVYGVSWAITEPSETIDLSEIDDMAHTSQLMRLTLRECLRLAKTETHVLLTGERGSGKDYLANYIHDNSNRNNKEIMAVNCSEFTAELMSSELFGHVKGAFSGATRDNPGIISAANGSTLFLNEIGELPVQLQSRLLSFLDNGTFRRVGDKGTKKADVRVMAATNKDLEKEVTASRFRADLYDRLNVFHVVVPPLRHRKEEIPALVKQLLAELCEKAGLQEIPEVDSHVFELFSQYHWPGNVRELKNTLARALVLAPNGPITKNHISLGGSKPSASHVPETTENSFGKDRPAVSLSDQEFENAKQRFFQLNRQDQQAHLKAMFVEVCGRESGSVTYIAELTGMSKETVRKQLKAAKAGKSGRSRPRQKAREDLIPKLQKYLIANV